MNMAVIFTVLLLALMAGAGFVSASWGYALGRQALMGVRQPDSRPTSTTNGGTQPTSNRQGVTFRSEQEILEEMRTRTLGATTPTMIMPPPPAPSAPEATPAATPTSEVAPDPMPEAIPDPTAIEPPQSL